MIPDHKRKLLGFGNNIQLDWAAGIGIPAYIGKQVIKYTLDHSPIDFKSDSRQIYTAFNRKATLFHKKNVFVNDFIQDFIHCTVSELKLFMNARGYKKIFKQVVCQALYLKSTIFAFL